MKMRRRIWTSAPIFNSTEEWGKEELLFWIFVLFVIGSPAGDIGWEGERDKKIEKEFGCYFDDAWSILTCKELDNWLDLFERKMKRRNIIKCLISWWLCAYYQSTASHKIKDNNAIYLCQCVALINATIDNVTITYWLKECLSSAEIYIVKPEFHLSLFYLF